MIRVWRSASKRAACSATCRQVHMFWSSRRLVNRSASCQMVSLLPAESTSSGPAGAEVVGPGVEHVSHDDLGPFGGQELGIEPGLAEFEQHVLPLIEGLGVVDDAASCAGTALRYHTTGELVDVDDVDAGEKVWSGQGQQSSAEVGGEVAVEGGQQDGAVLAGREPFGEVLGAVQCHDRLSCAGPAADAGGAVVVTFDESALGRV